MYAFPVLCGWGSFDFFPFPFFSPRVKGIDYYYLSKTNYSTRRNLLLVPQKIHSTLFFRYLSDSAIWFIPKPSHFYLNKKPFPLRWHEDVNRCLYYTYLYIQIYIFFIELLFEWTIQVCENVYRESLIKKLEIHSQNLHNGILCSRSFWHWQKLAEVVWHKLSDVMDWCNLIKTSHDIFLYMGVIM